MSDETATAVDEYCASLLAACDDAALAGEASAIFDSPAIPEELRARMQRAMAAARVLRQSFGRKSAGADEDAPLPWATLGRFQVRRELGRGAFGVVYLAYDPLLRREVALKVPGPQTIVTPEVGDRFLREARAAACLEHPNLVPVYEAGQLGPVCYLASAYCPGQTLAAWLKERQELTPWRDAADLVATLADAVEHAHGRGVLHRDLKPANVLLQTRSATAQPPGAGDTAAAGPAAPAAPSPPDPLAAPPLNAFVPRITDFGLAKILPGQDAELTRSGAVMGTPAYMAPEQASGRTAQATRRADVYALGVILYELLTGRLPFRAETALETLEQVRSREPVSPRLLRLKLPRDLETVCLKCLEKEPKRRYESAGELRNELRRYLRGEPVRARPVGAAYRAARWCRRKPALAVTGGLAAAGLLGTLGLAVGLAVQQGHAAAQLRDEVARARAEEARAEQSAKESRAVLGFLRDNVLSAARPKGRQGGLGRLVTIREAVDAAEPSIAKAFAGQPLVEAAVRDAVGMTYGALTEPAFAIPQLELAAKLRRAHLGPDHPATLDSMNNLAAVYILAGRHAEAIGLFAEVFRIDTAKLGPDHPQTLRVKSRLAEVYIKVGRLGEAVSLASEVLRLQKANPGPDHPDTLYTMETLANGYIETGRPAEAVALLEKVAEHHKSVLGTDHPDTLWCLGRLAHAYRIVGRINDAIVQFEQVLQLEKTSLGPEHAYTLDTMNDLAIAYHGSGHLSKALSLFEETFARRKSKQGPEHPETLNTAGNLALTYRLAGRTSEAVPLLEQTLNVRKAKLGPKHPQTLRSMNNLASGYCDCGRLSEAIPLGEETLKLRKEVLGAEHPSTLDTMRNLAVAYQGAGRLTEAIALQADALKLRKAKLGEDSLDTFESMLALGEAHLYAGHTEEAAEQYADALTRIKAKLGPDHHLAFAAVCGLARTRVARADYTTAEALLADARSAADRREADIPQEAAAIRELLGECLTRRESYAEAEPLFRAALQARERMDAASWKTSQAKSLLGEALLGQGKYAEAEPFLLAGAEGLQQLQARTPVPERARAGDAFNRVVRLYEAWGKKEAANQWRTKPRPATPGDNRR
jgi:hypothetical protein